MPRETRESVTRLSLPDPAAPQVKSVVAARPVDVPLPSVHGGEMDALLRGLSQFNDKLTQYVNDEADRDVERGMKTAANGAPLDDNATEWFKHGYMNMSGKVAGQTDGEAGLRQAYENSFDKDGGNIEQFLSQQFAARTKGLQDKSYLS